MVSQTDDEKRRFKVQQNYTESVWVRYEQSVSDAISRHHYMKASNLMKEALQTASALKSSESGLLKSADALADLHVQLGDFQSAASLYRLSLEVKKNAYGSSHPMVEETMQAFLRVLSEAGSISPMTNEQS
jgi:hypothetical protein